MDTTPALFQTTPEVVGFVVGKLAVHAVDDPRIWESSDNGIVQRANWPFCI